ncbi:MAG: methyltransferase domain-containing protein [Ruminococcaceae bacterium]|nr:methyltransferase domain-containing protein [Oscillospiraceae bacterium]
MIDLLTVEKQFIASHVREGGTVVDFTMGNGHDTLWLAQQVGETGKVYAFDIQPKALENSEKLLRESGCPQNYTLILDSHANVEQYVKEPICAGMFNLGYLPGSDKSVTTLRESTMKAVEGALRLLEDDGGLLIAVYPGHEEGSLEGKMLDEFFATLDRKKICVSKLMIVNSPTSPFFFLVEKR